MAYAEERLEAAEKRLAEIASSLFTLRAVGVSLWSFVPSAFLVSSALGSFTTATFSNISLILLAIAIIIATNLYTAALGRPKFSRRALNSSLTFAAAFSLFSRVLAVFYPLEMPVALKAIPSAGSPPSSQPESELCLDGGHTFNVLTSLALALFFTYSAVIASGTQIKFPLIQQTRIHRVRTEVGGVLADSFASLKSVFGLWLLFPVFAPLASSFLIFIENFYFELPLIGVGEVTSVCGLRSTFLPSWDAAMTFTDLFAVLYACWIGNVIMRYVRSVVEVVLTESASFEKLKDQFQDGLHLNGTALLIAALKPLKGDVSFSRELLRSLAFSDVVIRAKYGNAFRKEIFSDETATYLNTLMASLGHELETVPKFVESFVAYRIPKSESSDKKSTEENKTAKGKKWFDSFLEKYLKAFEGLVNSIAEFFSSNVRNSSTVRSYTETQLTHQIFGELQLKLWAADAMSSIVLKSKEEDKVGIVQLNSHLQKTLNSFFDVLEALGRFDAVLLLNRKGEPLYRSFAVVHEASYQLTSGVKQATYALVIPFSANTDLKGLLRDRSGLVQSFIALEQ